MPAKWRGAIALVVGSLWASSPLLITTPAHATTTVPERHHLHHHHVRAAVQRVAAMPFHKHAHSKAGKMRYAHGGGISCVPFARAASGIALKGNAVNWWDAAAGVYERGSAPEAGSVLNFRATGHMRLGHVAVVTNVLNAREIEIDHANWSGPGAMKGGVSRGIVVEDVSANNDWTAVRVALGHTGDFGSVYPTYGFIYDRPDDGHMLANAHPAALPVNDRVMLDEVAEAPPAHPLARASLPVDAPDRSFR
jgi:surface antigen